MTPEIISDLEPTTDAELVEAVKRWITQEENEEVEMSERMTVEEMMENLQEAIECRPPETPISNARLQEIVSLYAPNAPHRSAALASVRAESPNGASVLDELKQMAHYSQETDTYYVYFCEACRKYIQTNTCCGQVREKPAWTNVGGARLLVAGREALGLKPFPKPAPPSEPKPAPISWIWEHTTKADEVGSEPPKWIIENMIFKTGVHLFSGREGTTKSIFNLALANAIARGFEFMGRENNEEPIPVIYIDRENPRSVVGLRLAKLGLLGLETFRIWGDWNADNPPPASFDDEKLFECARRERPFFIFDSLSSFLNGANEIDNGQMSLVMGKARTLARQCAGVSIIHHQGVDTNRSRGGTAIAAASDMAFLLAKQQRDGKDRITLSDERFRMAERYQMVWDMTYGERYTMTVVENSPTRSRTQAKTEQTDAELIQRAKTEIEKAYAEGHTVTQRQLASLVGIGSCKVKQRVLSRENRPWRCTTGPKNSTYFLPIDA